MSTEIIIRVMAGLLFVCIAGVLVMRRKKTAA